MHVFFVTLLYKHMLLHRIFQHEKAKESTHRSQWAHSINKTTNEFDEKNKTKRKRKNERKQEKPAHLCCFFC